jgi:hypothetical protein
MMDVQTCGVDEKLEILYTDRSSEDEQLSVGPVLRKSKRTKFHLICFYIKHVFDIRDTNMTAEKHSWLYKPINLFIFRIYNRG